MPHSILPFSHLPSPLSLLHESLLVTHTFSRFLSFSSTTSNTLSLLHVSTVLISHSFLLSSFSSSHSPFSSLTFSVFDIAPLHSLSLFLSPSPFLFSTYSFLSPLQIFLGPTPPSSTLSSSSLYISLPLL